MTSSDKALTGRWIRPLFTIVLVATLGTLTLLLPGWLQPETAEGIQLKPPACDLNQGSCRLKQGDIELAFSLGPAPIQSLQELTARLTLQGVDVERVHLSLEGRDMYMGLNQTELTPTGTDGGWQGTTELAACTTGSMVWRARLTLESKRQHYVTWFDFEAK
ncbi:hypothetical protein GCM10011352_22170 [Marinobacterium zhoushanense]|uniref:Uncharacterized protein n=1 Tax=Marinobacterium zhoushanense TaxID=1679163 RepID=A0ABQ1KFA9_9GAMM|nr:hypothetical protein [Marinobacterium zhoushanense]GGB95647.1 hypothetical protein GCM10011352_22170 [Marinobacterium zhoushanense]